VGAKDGAKVGKAVGTAVGEREGAPVYTGMLSRNALATVTELASTSSAVILYSSAVSRAAVNVIVMEIL
jgi:hypothetical protein